MSRAPTRLVPFQGAPLPRGNFGGLENNTQEIINAVGSLIGAATTGVQAAAGGEVMKRQNAEAEFRIEQAEAQFERVVAQNEADELEFEVELAALDNKEAADNLKRVAELERGKLPALLSSMSTEEKIATLKLYPAMAPENAERLGKGIGEDLADTALVERLAVEGNALRANIQGVRDAADGEGQIPDSLGPIRDWITTFNTQIELLPDNVRNPALTRFSGRLRAMVEDQLLQGAAQEQSEAEDFAENNLKLQVQRLIAGDEVESNDPVDLREAIDRMTGLTGASTETIEEHAGELLRRGVLSRLDAGGSAVDIQESLAGIDRRSRIWQAANTGEQGELDTLVSRAREAQQVSADEGIRRNLQATAIDMERTWDLDGLRGLLEDVVPRMVTPDIRDLAKLDIETRITVVRSQQAEFVEADAVMAGTRDGRARGWTRETLERMYQREIGKGQQKWEVAGRMAEHLGQIGPRVTQDIADNFTDGIANADEGLRMILAIWQKDSALAANVLHGLSTFGRAGTKQRQGVRARVLFDLAKEHEPGSAEWNRLAELGQRAGFLPGLIEGNTSLDTVEGFPVDDDAGTLSGRTLIQHEVGELLSGTPGIVTPGIIDLYRSHYAIAYAREYSDTRAPTLPNTPERLARIEAARTAASEAITGRWVAVDEIMLTSQQLALSPEMARDEAVAQYLNESVDRFRRELFAGVFGPEGRPVRDFFGAQVSAAEGVPLTHRMFSPDNINTYLPAGDGDPDNPEIVAFMAIEPFRRKRKIILPSDPEFRPLLRASGITITAETVGPSARFLWHPQYQVGTVEDFATKFFGDDFVEKFYISASEAWIDEGEGPPDMNNRGFVAFLDTYAKRHKWNGWLSGTTIRGEPVDPFQFPEPPQFDVTDLLGPRP